MLIVAHITSLRCMCGVIIDRMGYPIGLYEIA